MARNPNETRRRPYSGQTATIQDCRNIPFYDVSNKIVDDYELGHHAFRVYHVLARFGFTLVDNILDYCLMTEEEFTLALQELKEKGLINYE